MVLKLGKNQHYLSVPFIGDAGNLNFFPAHFYGGHNLQSLNFLLTFYDIYFLYNKQVSLFVDFLALLYGKNNSSPQNYEQAPFVFVSTKFNTNPFKSFQWKII